MQEINKKGRRKVLTILVKEATGHAGEQIQHDTARQMVGMRHSQIELMQLDTR